MPTLKPQTSNSCLFCPPTTMPTRAVVAISLAVVGATAAAAAAYYKWSSICTLFTGEENARLKQQVKELENKLATTRDTASGLLATLPSVQTEEADEN